MDSDTISSALFKSNVSDTSDACTIEGLEAFKISSNSAKSFQHLNQGSVITFPYTCCFDHYEDIAVVHLNQFGKLAYEALEMHEIFCLYLNLLQFPLC